MTTVRVCVSTPLAINAGINDQGCRDIEVDVTLLSAEQRSVLAQKYSERDKMPVIHGAGAHSAEAVMQILERESVEKRDRATHRDAHTAQQIAWYVAAPLDQLTKLVWAPSYADGRGKWSAIDRHAAHATGAYDNDRARVEADTGVVSKYAEVMASIAAQNAVLDREDAEKAARDEVARAAIAVAKEAAASRRKQQLDAWVSANGTAGQKKRRARDLLAESEIVDGIREQTFSPMENAPKFEKITRIEVLRDIDADDDDDYNVEFTVLDAPWAPSDGAIELMERAETAIPGAKATLRLHKGGLESVDEWEIERYSVHVAVQVGELNLSREYAVLEG